MSRIHANNFSTTINGAITNSATSVTLTSVTGFPTIGAGVTCNLTLQSGATIEIVTATAQAGNTLTITRASEGTTAVAWASGSIISIRPTADSVDRKRDISVSTDTITQNITIGGNSTAAGYIELLEDTDNGSNKLTITGQQAMSSNKTATFQDVTGTVYVSNGTDVAIADGGTGVSSVTTTPTASAFAGWDANSNLSANNFLTGYTSTATAAGTTTLTVASTQTQIFTGSSTQTVTMPVVSTLALGTFYRIVNLSSGVVTVQSSGANTIQAMQANSTLILISNATTGTSASVWYVIDYATAATGQTGSGSLVRATSPTLTTPVLGAATATSINFGSSTLSTYEQGTFSPTFTCVTVGDLSVSYATQTGIYTRIGNFVYYTVILKWTPTYTTASGNIRIGSFPFTPNSSGIYVCNAVFDTANVPTYPSSGTWLFTENVGGTSLGVYATKSAAVPVALAMSDLTSGLQYRILLTGCFNV